MTIAQVPAPIGMEENTVEEEESSDNDFLAGNESSCEEHEEVVQIQKKSRVFKKNMKSGQVASLDDVILDR